MRDQAIHIARILRDVEVEEFMEEEDLRILVERRMEIIGEAANHVSREFRLAHDEIPWRLMIGQRNVIVHQYNRIAPERIWLTATGSVPELLRLLNAILPTEDDA
jgi:uncharacterized protein with HEPN domain